MARGVRPGSRGVRPSGPEKRSAFNLKPSAKSFEKFKSSFEEVEEEFLGVSHRVIEVIDASGNEARVHVTGLSSPIQPVPYGVLKILEHAIVDEMKPKPPQLLLDQRFRSSNHIRPPCRAYRPRCERRAPD